MSRRRVLLRRAGRLAAASLVTVVISACSFGKSEIDCELIEEYQQSRSAPDIVVPPGLSSPDESAKLTIPAGPVPAEPLSVSAACLQRPPNYFDKPLTAAPPN